MKHLIKNLKKIWLPIALLAVNTPLICYATTHRTVIINKFEPQITVPAPIVESTKLEPLPKRDWFSEGMLLVYATILANMIIIVAARRDSSRMVALQAQIVTQQTKSAEEQARSAAAMESFANTMKDNIGLIHSMTSMLPKQARAYVHADHAQVWYQEEAKNIKFEARIALKNTGMTPAKNVSWKYKISIDDDSIVSSDPMITSINNSSVSDMMIVPHGHQPVVIGGIFHVFVKNTLVKEVLDNRSRIVLRVSGRVVYQDVYNETHETNFSWHYQWNAGKDPGTFIPDMWWDRTGNSST